MHSLPSDGQSLWHGNIETSTDTLVPVIESNHSTDSGSHCVDITSNKLYTTTSSLIDDATNCSGFIQRNINDSRPTRGQPPSPPSDIPIAVKPSKNVWTNGGSVLMDESILMQPENQRMDICNGSRTDGGTPPMTMPPMIMNGVGIGGGGAPTSSSSSSSSSQIPLHRRRRNSSNSKQATSIDDKANAARYAHVSEIRQCQRDKPKSALGVGGIINGLSPLPSTTTPSASTSAPPIQTISSPIVNISCPDGLAHALSEQNLRLQQLVHDHRVTHRT